MATPIEFSKILIFKDTPMTRYFFGEPLVNHTSLQGSNPYYNRLRFGDSTGDASEKFHGSNPAELLTDPYWLNNNILSNNLLNSIGTEENNMAGYDLPPTSSGTAIIYEDKFYIGGAGLEFTQTTTFATPTPDLVQGDFIFWGDDPNNLKIGGRILKVYVDGEDPEYDDGARYQFEKFTAEAFPIVSGDIVPQDIYYYRKTWNGKGISNTVSNGFYVLIGIEKDSSNYRAYWPFLDTFGPNDNAGPDARIINTATNEKYAYTDLIRVRRISELYKADETYDDAVSSQEIIPCTIHRTNSFWWEDLTNLDQNGNLTSLFTTADSAQAPAWCAYYVNPLGLTSQKLGKNTTYVVEVNERLPSYYRRVQYQDTEFFGYASTGAI